MEALILVAEEGGTTMFARTDVLRALNSGNAASPWSPIKAPAACRSA